MALFDKSVDIRVPGLEDVVLPRVARVRQKLSSERVADIDAEMSRKIDALPDSVKGIAGKRVAVTGGSRGIADYARLMRALVSKLKALGAEPFIVPAMGSHGGGTAEGQREMLETFGITEAAMGVPIVASMETVVVGELPDGTKVHCDRHAWEADGIVLFNRVKAHTDFKGEWESGLLKMIAIGLGKHEGATAIHRAGFVNFRARIPEAGKYFLAKGKVLFGVTTVENGHEQVMRIDAVAPGDIAEREFELLALAKENMARLPFDELDILFVDEIGKNISGSGMDPNVMGRPGWNTTFPGTPKIGCIAVTGLSKETHRNALGVGAAEIVTRDVVEEMDLAPMYINHITSGAIRGAAIPLVARDDEEAVRISLYTVPAKTGGATFVRIRSTLMLEEFEVSENMLPDLRGRPETFTILEAPRPMRFVGGKLERI
jgi:hypothetical protein